MKHFFVITNPDKDPNLEATHKVEAFLTSHGASFVTLVRERKRGEGPSYTDIDAIPQDTECILVLGGDGTLLEASRDTAGSKIPLIGINLGNLGFLTEVEVSNLESALLKLLQDQYHLEDRMMEKGQIIRGDTVVDESFALNDIVITRSGSMQILHFHIYVNGQFLKTYSADGVIVSTPTGSTGYNMSAGGPIVEPVANLMVITPICPHTFYSRSIVLSADDCIEVEIAKDRDPDKQIEANFDGGHSVPLQVGDRIRITRSEITTGLLKLSSVSFLQVLHKKISE